MAAEPGSAGPGTPRAPCTRATSALFATGARSPEEREASGGVALGSKPPATNTPFAGGKGGLHEGGVRLPAIVNWSARLKPSVVNEPLHHVDVMPTLLALAGGTGDPTELFDVEKDPGEKENVADKHPDVLKDLEARLLTYAKQQKMSEWMQAQTDFLGFQGETLLDPGYNIDRGLPTEKPVIPQK